MYSAKDVAAWMKEEFEAHGSLDLDDALWQIRKRFGKEFVYETDAGGEGIAQAVRTQFAKLCPDSVWERSYRQWRRRDPGETGRRSEYS